MGSPSELTLDYKPTTANQSLLHKALGDHPDHPHKLEEFVARLEEERLKIDAFKRELPLCMLLLNNAMETYKQQLEACQTSPTPRPVLEEFIPMKNMDTDGEKAAANGSVPDPDKAVWMASEQLWNQQADGETVKNREKDNIVHAFSNTSPKLGLDNKGRNGGAFLPFKDKAGKTASAVAARVVHELVLAPSEKNVESNKNDKLVDAIMPTRMDHAGQGGSCGQVADAGKAPGSANQPEGGAVAPAQTQRKARRCWSPDLHRRFVNALQMLGGSQVATPKQIRELMKVDGLTNDEVKSHLQKYRLHTRRPAPAPPSAMATTGPQVVVVGGIWVPPEYATAGTAIYSTHPGAAAHYCPAGPVPQEFYTPHHLRHHVAPHPMAVHHRGAITPYRGSRGSPESEGKCGERSESMEDGEEGTAEEEEEEEEERKSDGWKGGEEKAREDGGDASNGGDVALKF